MRENKKIKDFEQKRVNRAVNRALRHQEQRQQFINSANINKSENDLFLNRENEENKQIINNLPAFEKEETFKETILEQEPVLTESINEIKEPTIEKTATIEEPVINEYVVENEQVNEPVIEEPIVPEITENIVTESIVEEPQIKDETYYEPVEENKEDIEPKQVENDILKQIDEIIKLSDGSNTNIATEEKEEINVPVEEPEKPIILEDEVDVLEQLDKIIQLDENPQLEKVAEDDSTNEEIKVETEVTDESVVEEVKQDKKKKRFKKEKIKKEKIKKEKDESDPRPKGSKKTFTFAVIISIILSIALLGVIGAGIFAYKLCEGMPDLNVEELVAPDSSTIYDNEGNKIMQVGMYLRENIDYDEMPNCLIDAFLSIEDSRFFEHFGVDIPRFTKSAISYVMNGSEFAQGGSTITMQLIKNTYFTIDDGDNSTIAVREGMGGIKRKMQEIILSSELELLTDTDKKDIIKMYINKVNYGDNIRGVEKAAEYYFGKRASQLNLSEAAFLAGIVNSPASYNPYGNIYKEYSIYYDEEKDYVASGTQRRNEVLNLMVLHGYISEEEANLAKSVKLENLLAGPSNDFDYINEKYQWYIDAVIDEVEELTGESPYDVGMNIYTNMNPYMQEFIYDAQNEEEYTKIVFPNDQCQSAIVLMDNQTGAVEALGGGRGKVDSARKFNRATNAYLNPGSSMKPVVDYSLAIEHLGWATSHTITDQPYYLYDGNALISNYDHTYYGDMLMTEALGRSQNTPAVQTLVAVVDKIEEKGVVDYLNSIGFEFEYEDFDLQFAIGGNRCLATPEQMAGAHAIFMNGGKYIKPHTINYIEYVDGRDTFVADTVGKQVLSPETAWMTAYLERYNLEGSFYSLMWACKRDYPLYGKTGTTDWADAGVEFGIPVGATKDSWLIMQSNRYTISCWTGYDELEKGAYFTNSEYQENTKSKIVSAILDQLEEHASYADYDPSKEMEMPEGVVKITHVKGAYPYASYGGEMVTGYTSKKALEEHPLVSYDEAIAYAAKNTKKINVAPSEISGYYDGNTVSVNFTVNVGQSGLVSGEGVDLSSSNVYGDTCHATGRIWFPHWNAVYIGSASPPFKYRVEVNDNVTAEGTTDGFGFVAPAYGGRTCTVYISSAEGGEVSQDIPIAQ